MGLSLTKACFFFNLHQDTLFSLILDENRVTHLKLSYNFNNSEDGMEIIHCL